MAFLIEKLKVYGRAVDLAESILVLSDRFSWRSRAIIDQLSRAAISIPANIAEANGRHSCGERRQFLRIARGSLLECVPLMEIARRRGLVTEEEHAEVMANAEQVSRMLAGLLASISERTP